MNFVFYQNILSIHQSAFIRHLAEKHQVTLVVEEALNKEREKDGWINPDFGNTEIIIKPTSSEIDRLISFKDALHIFSGINSFPLSTQIFNLAVNKKLKIGVILEPFNWMGVSGKLRFIKYFILRLKYNRKLQFILAIGDRGRWCYEKVGFFKNKIFDWAYFTESVECEVQHKPVDDLPSLLFVGSISKRKNIIPFVREVKYIKQYFKELNIIGIGDLADELLLEIREEPQIKYLGGISNSKIPQCVGNSDLLILPSLFDGWGAVVNEALMCGVPAFASDHCGASVLLKGIRGCVYSVKKKDLCEQLINFSKELPYTDEKKKDIRDWAVNNISGKAAADYFESIIKCENDKRLKPTAPWLND